MADTPDKPPGWPFDEGIPEIPEAPPATPATPGPVYQPPPPQTFEPASPPAPGHPPAPGQPPPPGQTGFGQQPPPPPSEYQPPSSYEPPPPPRQVPASLHQPPRPPNAYPPPPSGHSHYPPLQPKKRMAVWKKVLLVLGILSLPIIGCSVWLFSISKPAFDEANTFLAEIDRADYEAAASRSTCGLSPAELEEFFAGRGISYNLRSSSIQNGNRAVVSGGFTMAGSSASNVDVELRKVGDDWRVCSVFVN